METTNEFVAAMKHRFAGVPSEEEVFNYILIIQKLISDLEAATTKDQNRVRARGSESKAGGDGVRESCSLKGCRCNGREGKEDVRFPWEGDPSGFSCSAMCSFQRI